VRTSATNPRSRGLAAVAISQELMWGYDDGYEEEPPQDQPPPPSTGKPKRRSKLKVVPSR
jgi:hypothetical protein